MPKIARMLLVVALVGKAAFSSASAGAFYVSSDGKADGDGSQDRPFSSVESAPANVGGGHTIIVKPGVYRGPIQIARRYAGTKEARPEARKQFADGWPYYRHGSGAIMPDFWLAVPASSAW